MVGLSFVLRFAQNSHTRPQGASRHHFLVFFIQSDAVRSSYTSEAKYSARRATFTSARASFTWKPTFLRAHALTHLEAVLTRLRLAPVRLPAAKLRSCNWCGFARCSIPLHPSASLPPSSPARKAINFVYEQSELPTKFSRVIRLSGRASCLLRKPPTLPYISVVQF